jgi:hypothetical protein
MGVVHSDADDDDDDGDVYCIFGDVLIDAMVPLKDLQKKVF